MQTEKFEFNSPAGHRLAARLDRPEGTPTAYALFAHCFTCDKQAKAAVRISHALAGVGVATARFDFTGLGESEGELTGFSANVEDLRAAMQAMTDRGWAPALLIGHSLGGTAALAAAPDLASVKAVATIGAPGDAAHVLKLLGDAVTAIEEVGSAEVNIGGRPFVIDRAFVEDARMQQLHHRIAHLGRALLILHAPTDAQVGIDNATEIFLAARHPKSFVSLDHADHLLTRGEDADYAATVICAWASRYVGMAAKAAAEPRDDLVRVQETGAGKFQVIASVRDNRFVVDEPADVGGLGSGPTPYELISAGLGACTSMTARLYAERKGWPLQRTRVTVAHEKIEGQTPPDRFTRQVAFDGPLSAEQVAKLFEIVDRCPVHRTLENGSHIDTLPMAPAAPPTAPPPVMDEHFREMQHECDKADAAEAAKA